MSFLTTQQVADHYAVKQNTVIRWIKSGRLEAIDIGTANRPTYRIPADAISSVPRSSMNAKRSEGVKQII